MKIIIDILSAGLAVYVGYIIIFEILLGSRKWTVIREKRKTKKK